LPWGVLLCTQFAWHITINDVKTTFIVVIDIVMIDLLIVRLVFRRIWSAQIERDEAIRQELEPNLWWRYHAPVVLLRFWLVVLSALLIRHGTDEKRGNKGCSHGASAPGHIGHPCYIHYC
jgi:hypothetical protein